MSTVTRARTVRHRLALAARRHTRMVAFAAVVGPGVLAGLSDDDPAGITTYSILGADFGYRLLWVLLLSTIALIVFHELGATYALVVGVGALVVLVPGAPLVPILFITQAINAVLLLPLLAFIALLTRDRSLMGKYATGRAWTVVIVAVTLMIAAATVVLGVVPSAARPAFEICATGVVVWIARNLSEIAEAVILRPNGGHSYSERRDRRMLAPWLTPGPSHGSEPPSGAASLLLPSSQAAAARRPSRRR